MGTADFKEEIPYFTRCVRDGGPTTINIQQIKDWLHECEKSHTNCIRRSHCTWVPTRLLDLDPEDGMMKLIETGESRPIVPYATLSHRWGNFEYEKLNTNSINRFKISIEESRLPKVFQDAIKVTRSLQIRYLWIDSLCIKQDKESGDWDIEALKMGDVYTNSYLNLSASHAADQGENPPLFDPESSDNICPSKIEWKCDKPIERNVILDADIWKDEVTESPLMARGWVFQERLLPSRVLHFGFRQLAWECNSLSALEMFPSGLPSCLNAWPKSETNLSTMRPNDSTTASKFRKFWQEIVRGYSACKLTFQTDKLVALSGIVKTIESKRDDTYIAGLWKSTLREHLGWYYLPEGDALTPASETTFRAPSWTWLSIDGEVSFYWDPNDDSLTYLCDILEIPPTEDVGSSVFTASGRLKMQGLILPLSMQSLDSKTTLDIMGIRLEEGPRTSFDPDSPGPEVEDLCSKRNLFLVPLYASTESIIAIMTTQVERSDSFRRVGAAQIQFAQSESTITSDVENWVLDKTASVWYHPNAMRLCRLIGLYRQAGRQSVFYLI
jgi:hypothetical protein